MTDDEAKALAKIKQLANEGKIKFATNDEVAKYQFYIDKIVTELGKKPHKVWISDRSMITDTIPYDVDKDVFCKLLSEKLGVSVLLSDKFTDVARRMAEKEEHGSV